MNRYTSKIIRVVRNSFTTIEVPFRGKYLYLKVLLPGNIVHFEGTTLVTLRIDDGDEIVLPGLVFELDNFDFKKLTINVGAANNSEDIPFFYFITGDGEGNKEVAPEVVTETRPALSLEDIPSSTPEIIQELKNALITLKKYYEK